jgi:predicted protein tyrosine phosphatase
MTPAQKLLFVCGQNRHRSLTAERMYEGFPGYEVLSAGTVPAARIRVTREHLEWADLIFVMELEHAQRLRQKFKQSLEGKRVICLNIPDTYGYMNLGLIQELKKKLSDYVAVPKG